MPWEIFRTKDMLFDSDRIQIIVTKAGGVKGYTSQLLLIPEYELGIVILVAGDGHALGWLRDEILKTLVPSIEKIARQQTAERLSGTFISADSHVNSSISVEVQGSRGLVLTSWVSNGTDFLSRYVDIATKKKGFNGPGEVQLTPAGVRRGDHGEVWRAQFVPDDFPSAGIINMHLIDDVDQFNYASRSVDEFVFQLNASGYAVEVELPAFRIRLARQQNRSVQHCQQPSASRIHGLMKPLGFFKRRITQMSRKLRA